MAKDTYRLQHMGTAFARAGVSFTRFHAIDAASAEAHPLRAGLKESKKGPWLGAEIGCLLSHFEIWRTVAAGTDAFAGVFEDDIQVDSRLGQVLDNTETFPRDADIIKLETAPYQTVYVSRKVAGSPVPGLLFRRLITEHKGTAGYIISKAAASRLIERYRAYDAPVDILLFSPTHPLGRTLRIYQLVPAPVIQDMSLGVFSDKRMRSGIVDERHRNLTLHPPRESIWHKVGSKLEIAGRVAGGERMVVPYAGMSELIGTR